MAKPEIYFQPPARHWTLNHCSFDTFRAVSDSQHDALHFLKQFNAQSAVGLYLHGPTGRGKSHLLVAAARSLKNNGASVSYCDGTSLWPNISQNTISYRSSNPIVSADVVIIDDIDLKQNEQIDSWLFYKLILNLYDYGKPTLISSNHSPEGLVNKLVVAKGRTAVATAAGGEVLTEFGSDTEMRERTLDRLSEMCLFIDLLDAPPGRRKLQEGYTREYRHKPSG